MDKKAIAMGGIVFINFLLNERKQEKPDKYVLSFKNKIMSTGQGSLHPALFLYGFSQVLMSEASQNWLKPYN